MIIGNPSFRDLMKEALSDTKELINSWEYGIFVGRK